MTRDGLIVGVLVLVAGMAAHAREARATPSADAVVTEDHTTFRVDGTKGTLVRRQTVRVLGPGGRDYSALALGYDTFRTIKHLHGRLLDGGGRELRRLGRADIADYPATDGYSLYDDQRIRIAELYHDRYPYTVEWEYEVRYETLLNWPSWYPQAGLGPVLDATLVVDAPADVVVRYRPQHLDTVPVVLEERGRRLYRWGVALPARVEEPLGADTWGQAPAVHFATDTFEVKGHAGSLRSWEAFGAWYRDLSAGRDVLPAPAAAEMAALVAGVDDPRERVRRLYHHLQSTTRYVSVQLGLGGWTPFDAAYVYERRYGDCKALTNYLRALLREVGIEAYPALIAAGRPDIEPDFPVNLFNHVILFVPLGSEEPVWLEATSPTAPFGQLSPGTEGRHALVVTPQGGRLFQTPTRPAAANTQIRTAEVLLHEDGQTEVDVVTRFAGYQLAERRGGFARATPSEREDWFRREVNLPGLTLHAVAFDGLEAADTTLTVSVRFDAERFGMALGRRLLFTPNLMERWGGAPPASPNRTQPVEAFRYPFVDVDTVRYTLPLGYAIDALPSPTVLETDFARYEAVLAEIEGGIVYVRRLELRESRLPAERYDAFRAFVEAVARADAQQVVLLLEE